MASFGFRGHLDSEGQVGWVGQRLDGVNEVNEVNDVDELFQGL